MVAWNGRAPQAPLPPESTAASPSMIPTAPSEGASRPSPRTAVFFVAGLAVLFFWGGALLRLVLGGVGLLLAEWLLLLTPTLVFLGWGGWDARATLSLRLPTAAGLTGGLLLVVGATPVGWLLAWLQTLVVPIPVEALEGLQRMVTAEGPGELLTLLLVLAVTPAICEEVVFRGFLLGATRTLPPWRALLLNGMVFGAFHLSVETWIRFLPTAWLGIVLAWAVWRTGSLWVAMVMHLANNGVIVLAASMPDMGAVASDPAAPPPLWLLPLAALALAAGLRITANLDGASQRVPTDEIGSEAT